MKVPYGWLREFVDLDLAPAEAADRLVNAGIEVASVTPLAPAGRAGGGGGEVGARAAFAPPGATLPGGRRIGVAKVHGVESQGMLCSERELGLGEEHAAGVLLVEDGAPAGGDLLAHLRSEERR